MNQRCKIIAEAGVNHNGSLDLALKLVDAAAAAGADVVKFQSFKSARLVSGKAPKADYQLKTTDTGESQLQMLQKLELSAEDHRALIDHCQQKKIRFLSTPFDLESVDLLAAKLRVSELKLSSGAVTDGPLLFHAARTGLPLILSTGMSSLAEVHEAVGLIAYGYCRANPPKGRAEFKDFWSTPEGRRAIEGRLVLLHCTTEYPCPFDEVNLKAMDTLRDVFRLPVGLSDHTKGYSVPVAAVARGATVIEKHFTLDRKMPGPDHLASLEPDELAAMVQAIREVEASMQGSGEKAPSRSEQGNREIVRKSLVAAHAIRAGELFTQENLTAKRAGKGLSPMGIWDVIGKPAPRDFGADEPVSI